MNNYTLTAYDNGRGFANAFRCLLKHSSIQTLLISGNYDDASMIMPTIVNGAFACELFLKALIKEPVKIHSIAMLLKKYENENHGICKKIEDLCIKQMLEIKHEQNYNSDCYNRDLSAIDKAFEELRYWHEPVTENSKKRNTVYSLGFLDVLVAVLETLCIANYGKRPMLIKDKNQY